MAKEAINHKVRNVNDGHLYTIGDRKYQKQKHKWEIIETFRAGQPQVEPKVEEESVLKQIEEFMETDVVIGGDLTEELEDTAYHTLKEMAAEKGYEMKGNPKKEDLINFLSEATG